jgi:hypothetical protein
VVLDDETITLPEVVMSDYVKELPKDQFNTIVRWIKTVDSDRLKQLACIADAGMKRLRLKNRPRRAVGGEAPAGSDCYNSDSVQTWMSRVEPGDDAAVRQIVAIHATIHARIGG